MRIDVLGVGFDNYTMDQAVAEGTTGIALSAGFYVVRLGGAVAKVLVK